MSFLKRRAMRAYRSRLKFNSSSSNVPRRKFSLLPARGKIDDDRDAWGNSQAAAHDVGGVEISGVIAAGACDIKPDHLVVLELSSFMLEYLREMKWSPHVAVVTMITRDHLEWHGGFDGYIDAKANLFAIPNSG